MAERTQKVYALRHGETEWSLNGQHTGLTDLPLTEKGRQNAKRLKPWLSERKFAKVFTSPLQRAKQTCELSGVGQQAESDPDLVEWDYGDYEGLTTPEIYQKCPNWSVFTHGCPGGETPQQVRDRVERVITKIRATKGDVVIFAHGHLLRVLTVRWLNMPVENGNHFDLDTATVNVLGYYHSSPAIQVWNAPLVI